MINRYNILLIALTCTLFSGCGLYKQYEREDMHFVDSLYRRMSIPADSVSTSSLS